MFFSTPPKKLPRSCSWQLYAKVLRFYLELRSFDERIVAIEAILQELPEGVHQILIPLPEAPLPIFAIERPIGFDEAEIVVLVAEIHFVGPLVEEAVMRFHEELCFILEVPEFVVIMSLHVDVVGKAETVCFEGDEVYTSPEEKKETLGLPRSGIAEAAASFILCRRSEG